MERIQRRRAPSQLWFWLGLSTLVAILFLGIRPLALAGGAWVPGCGGQQALDVRDPEGLQTLSTQIFKMGAELAFRVNRLPEDEIEAAGINAPLGRCESGQSFDIEQERCEPNTRKRKNLVAPLEPEHRDSGLVAATSETEATSLKLPGSRLLFWVREYLDAKFRGDTLSVAALEDAFEMFRYGMQSTRKRQLSRLSDLLECYRNRIEIYQRVSARMAPEPGFFDRALSESLTLLERRMEQEQLKAVLSQDLSRFQARASRSPASK